MSVSGFGSGPGAGAGPQSFDAFAAEFDFVATRSRDHSYFLERLPERRRHALDVGCGGGGLVAVLAPHFERVRGVDVSEPMLALARSQRGLSNVDYRYGNADTFEGIERPGGAEGYDLIVSHTMLHHLKDSGAAARRLADLLAPGGRLLLVDNVSWTAAIPRIVFLVSAWRSLPESVLAHGLRDGWRIFRFRRSKPWVDHLVSDRYLTERQFRERYGAALPGAEMTRMSVFMGACWQAPAWAAHTPSA
jgi:SAM-dependent methyltransferase